MCFLLLAFQTLYTEIKYLTCKYANLQLLYRFLFLLSTKPVTPNPPWPIMAFLQVWDCSWLPCIPLPLHVAYYVKFIAMLDLC
jgi:hypothetical protein